MCMHEVCLKGQAARLLKETTNYIITFISTEKE